MKASHVTRKSSRTLIIRPPFDVLIIFYVLVNLIIIDLRNAYRRSSLPGLQ